MPPLDGPTTMIDAAIPAHSPESPEKPGGDTGVSERQEETAAAALRVLENAENPDCRLSFAEAAEKLNKYVDLHAELAKSLEQQTRWGLPDKLAEKGVIPTPQDYAHLFEGLTISEAAVKQILERAEASESFSVIFDPGNLTVSEAYKALIEDSGVPCWQEDKTRAKLDSVTEIDSASLNESLKEKNHGRYIRTPFEDLSYEVQGAVLKEAARKAAKSQKPETKLKPKIIFAPVKKTATPAVTYQDLALIGKQKLLSPSADLLRFRAKVESLIQEKIGSDRTVSQLQAEEYVSLLKQVLEDKKTADQARLTYTTRFSTYLLPNGDCLGWHYDHEQKRFELHLIPAYMGSETCDSIKVIEG